MSVLTEDAILSRTKAANLNEVRSLNIFALNIRDISVLRRTPNLEVLSLAQNVLDDTCLEAISALPCLKELYLRRNHITRVQALVNLSRLKNTLEILWLDENPVSADPLYRRLLLRILPKLVKLDQSSVSEADVKEAHADDTAALEALLDLARTAELSPDSLPLARNWAAAQPRAPVKHESIVGSSSSMRAAGAVSSPGGSPGPVGSPSPHALSPTCVSSGNAVAAICLLLKDLDDEGLDRVAAAAKDIRAQKVQGRPRAHSGYNT